MAITMVTSLMKFKDEDGNLTAIYPISKNNIVTTTGSGSAYEASIAEITDLTAGESFIMIPHVASTTTSPTLNVNNMGAIRIRRGISTNTTTTSQGAIDTWLSAGKPVRVTYDGTFWIADLPKPIATDLMGIVPIASGGTGASAGADGLKNLFAAGNTVLSSYQYGDALPDAGTPGRIFFLKV